MNINEHIEMRFKIFADRLRLNMEKHPTIDQYTNITTRLAYEAFKEGYKAGNSIYNYTTNSNHSGIKNEKY